MRIEFTALGLTFDAEVTEFYPGRPERISGPPENCEPGEPPYIEIDDLKVILYSAQEHIACDWLLDSDCAEEICQLALDAMLARYEDGE